MKRSWVFGLAAGGLAVGGVVLVVLKARKQTPAPGSPQLKLRVYHRERAAGVHEDLQAWLDWWQVYGPFAIVVCADGGVRTDAAKQRSYFLAGNSAAETLDQTAHGRAGALDVAPYRKNAQGLYAPDYSDNAAFKVIGESAEAKGLEWGGRWPELGVGKYDGPHLQVPGWRSLPYPPRPLVA